MICVSNERECEWRCGKTIVVLKGEFYSIIKRVYEAR